MQPCIYTACICNSTSKQKWNRIAIKLLYSWKRTFHALRNEWSLRNEWLSALAFGWVITFVDVKIPNRIYRQVHGNEWSLRNEWLSASMNVMNGYEREVSSLWYRFLLVVMEYACKSIWNGTHCIYEWSLYMQSNKAEWIHYQAYMLFRFIQT